MCDGTFFFLIPIHPQVRVILRYLFLQNELMFICKTSFTDLLPTDLVVVMKIILISIDRVLKKCIFSGLCE